MNRRTIIESVISAKQALSDLRDELQSGADGSTERLTAKEVDDLGIDFYSLNYITAQAEAQLGRLKPLATRVEPKEKKQ